MPKIDLGAVEEFEPIPDGTYEFILTAWEYVEESETSGEPYLKLEFTGDEGEAEGRKAWQNHSCQSKALWALKRTLRTLGADPEALSGEFDTDDLMPDLVGNPCRLRIVQEDYEGQTVNKIKRILPSAVAV